MQVKASIDEADIGQIEKGAQTRFTVDAYPNDVFTGSISEVRLEPQTVQNVVTYSVIIAVENSQHKLKPGMTANLTVIVDQRDDILTVPNAALRYSPSGFTAAQVSEMLQAGEGTAREGQTAVERPQGGANGGARGARAGSAGADGRVQRRVLWTVDGLGVLEPLVVRTGLSDGSRTEVLGANLHEGMEIVIGDLSEASNSATPTPGTTIPFGVGTSGRGRGGF
jgi:HlyD family secretion protein